MSRDLPAMPSPLFFFSSVLTQTDKLELAAVLAHVFSWGLRGPAAILSFVSFRTIFGPIVLQNYLVPFSGVVYKCLAICFKWGIAHFRRLPMEPFLETLWGPLVPISAY